MKIIVSITVLVVAGNVSAFPPDREELTLMLQRPEVPRCVAYTGYDPNEINKPGTPEGPKDGLLCFLKCMAEAAGAIQPDGSVNPDKMNEVDHKLNYLPKEEVDKLNECFSRIKVEECVDVIKFMHC